MRPWIRGVGRIRGTRGTRPSGECGQGRLCGHVHGQPPLAGLQILRGRRALGFAGRGICQQAFGLGGAIGFVLHLHPIGVGVAAGQFTGGPEPTLGRALQVGLEVGGGDRHGASYSSLRPGAATSRWTAARPWAAAAPMGGGPGDSTTLWDSAACCGRGPTAVRRPTVVDALALRPGAALGLTPSRVAINAPHQKSGK